MSNNSIAPEHIDAFCNFINMTSSEKLFLVGSVILLGIAISKCDVEINLGNFSFRSHPVFV